MINFVKKLFSESSQDIERVKATVDSTSKNTLISICELEPKGGSYNGPSELSAIAVLDDSNLRILPFNEQYKELTFDTELLHVAAPSSADLHFVSQQRNWTGATHYELERIAGYKPPRDKRLTAWSKQTAKAFYEKLIIGGAQSSSKSDLLRKAHTWQ